VPYARSQGKGEEENNLFNPPIYGLDWLDPKAGKGYLSTWEVNIVQCNEILLLWWNPHYRIKIKPYIFSLFFIFLSSLVELLCLFHFLLLFCWAFVLVCEWWRVSIFFHLGYGHEKHKNVYYVIHGGLTFRVQLEKWKHTWRLKPWSLLFELNGFYTWTRWPPNNNLMPNNEPRSAQISHYWSHNILGPTSSLKWAFKLAIFTCLACILT